MLSVPIFVCIYLFFELYLSIPLSIYAVESVFLLFIPFTITLGSTFAMGISYIKYTRNNEIVVSHHAKSHWKIVKITSFIVFGYIFTYGPSVFLIVYMLSHYGEDVYDNKVIYYFEPLCPLSGISDFIVYCVIDEEFKKYVKSLFYKLLCSPCRMSSEVQLS